MPEPPLLLLEFARGNLRETWTLHYGETAQQSYVSVDRAWYQDGSFRPYDRPTQRFAYRDVPRIVAALQKASRLMSTLRCAEVQAEFDNPHKETGNERTDPRDA